VLRINPKIECEKWSVHTGVVKEERILIKGCYNFQSTCLVVENKPSPSWSLNTSNFNLKFINESIPRAE